MSLASLMFTLVKRRIVDDLEPRHGSSQFQSRVEQARFKRRPTMKNLREFLVGRRGKAPLVPPYTLCNFKLDGAVGTPPTRLPQVADCR